MSTVAEFMTASPHTIGDDQPLARAHEMMRDYRIRHLPVLHGGKLIGVVSLGDLHLIETLGENDLTKIAVEDAMTPEPYIVEPDADLREVAAAMATHKYGTAIVTRGSKILGIFTTTDALRALTQT